MRKEDKGLLIEKIKETIKEYSAIYLAETTSLNAERTTNLRRAAFKAAYVEETVFVGEEQLDALVALKSKNELIADVVALLQSPAKNVISALQSGGNKLHGVLETLSKQEN